MDVRLDGKVAVVTGASRGIGLAIAEGFAADGANVVMVARNQGPLLVEADRIGKAGGGKTLAVAADMSIASEIERLFAASRDAFGGVDILVNGGADVPSSSPMKTSDDEWATGIAVKLMGYIRCARIAAKMMMERRGGSIIHIVSISGREALGASAAPGAINSALLNLNKTMADELAPHGVRVNSVNPGFTATARMERHTAAMARLRDMTQDELKKSILSTVPLRRFGTPEDIASIVRFLSSDRASYITGGVFNVDGGYTRSVF